MNYVSETTSTNGPNLTLMVLDNNVTLNTVNPISPNAQRIIYSRLDPDLLTSNMNWTRTSGSSTSWGVLGPKNTNAWFYLGSGQNITFFTSATDKCTTQSRTITFTAQSAYRIYSTATITQKMTIEFDNVGYSESLPQTVAIFDEKKNKEDKSIDVKQLFENGYFKSTNKLEIDVSKVSRGVKIIHLYFADNNDEKEKKVNERKTKKVIFTD